jgi:hypothetical protein
MIRQKKFSNQLASRTRKGRFYIARKIIMPYLSRHVTKRIVKLLTVHVSALRTVQKCTLLLVVFFIATHVGSPLYTDR